jgi:hypothetical protein
MRRRVNFGVVDPFDLSRKPAPRGTLAEFEMFVEDWPSSANMPQDVHGADQVVI